jgi:hypothetical protein
MSVRMQNEFNAINPSFVDGQYNQEFRRFPELVDKKLRFSGKFLLTEAEHSLIADYVKAEASALNRVCGIDYSAELLRFSKPVFSV